MFQIYFGRVAVGLVWVLIIIVAVSQQKNSDLFDATPVKSRELTEKQRANSKHFNFYRYMRSDDLTSLINVGKRQGSKIVQTKVEVGLGPVQRPVSPEVYFEELARASDAVILGQVTQKKSQFTENDGFLFTNYDVAVKEVLKNNLLKPLTSGATIDVIRPGGKVLIDDIIVIAEDRNSLSLPSNGHDIVLFLKFLAETGSYIALKYNEAYELDGSSVWPLTGASLPPGVIQDRDSFIGIIRIVSTK